MLHRSLNRCSGRMELEFSKDEERLVVIIHLLRTGETIKADEVLQNLN